MLIVYMALGGIAASHKQEEASGRACDGPRSSLLKGRHLL
jgi:hypothetical protein